GRTGCAGRPGKGHIPDRPRRGSRAARRDPAGPQGRWRRPRFARLRTRLAFARPADGFPAREGPRPVVSPTRFGPRLARARSRPRAGPLRLRDWPGPPLGYAPAWAG